jgi:hypothetical protein
VKAIACEPPEQHGLPLPRWSSAELARQAQDESVVASVSSSTVRRWLAEDAIKPWRYRSWIFPRGPAFADKAGRLLDLYQRRWHGVELGADEYVISADEKSQRQVLRRIIPTSRPSRGRVRIRAWGHCRLPGRLRRAPAAADGPSRADDRDHPVRGAGRAGDDHRAVRLGPPGVLGRRQRLFACRTTSI